MGKIYSTRRKNGRHIVDTFKCLFIEWQISHCNLNFTRTCSWRLLLTTWEHWQSYSQWLGHHEFDAIHWHTGQKISVETSEISVQTPNIWAHILSRWLSARLHWLHLLTHLELLQSCTRPSILKFDFEILSLIQYTHLPRNRQMVSRCLTRKLPDDEDAFLYWGCHTSAVLRPVDYLPFRLKC